MSDSSEHPKFSRGNSMENIRRTFSQLSTKSMDDPEAVPEFKVKYIKSGLKSNI